ncbi:MAG TPA: hypothetical protein VMU70_00330 [Candidatus Tyrphobacter sp.]|nr:hypothetical protein [Candidatus Tyrphobacter sp.]
MIIFLYGPDSYRRLAKKRELTAASEEKNRLKAESFDLSREKELDGFRNFIQSRSLFEPAKLALVENTFSIKLDKELKKILLELSEAKTPVVILSEESTPAAAYKWLLDSPVKSQAFPLLSGAELNAFVKKESAERNLALSPSAISTLIETYGSDSWGLTRELDKMALGGRLSNLYSRGNYFELIGALKYGREIRKRLAALEFILSARKDDAARVFNSLAYGMSGKKDFLGQLSGLDLEVKSGRLEYEEALLKAVLR